VLLDTPSGAVPSLADRFETRVGRTLLAFLGVGQEGAAR